jgi:hypothetical protein
VKGSRRLGFWVLKATGGQALGGREPEDRGGDHDQSRESKNSPRRGDGKSSDLLQHAYPSLRRCYLR